MFATKRNSGKFATATGTIVTVTHLPRLSLVLLRDWCITAKLIADRNAFGLANANPFGIRVPVLPNPMKVEAKGRMK